MVNERAKREIQAMPRELLEKILSLAEAAAKRDTAAVLTAVRNMTDGEAAEVIRAWDIVFQEEGK